MQSCTIELRHKKRAMKKQLRDAFRSAQVAKRLRPGDDVRELCAALAEFGPPETKSDARHYAKAALFAADALVRKANPHEALQLLDPLTKICADFALPTLQMQALVRLCVVLRRLELLHDASFCTDEGINLALKWNKKRFLKLFLEERAAVDALVAKVRASKTNELVFPIAEDYPRSLREAAAGDLQPRIEALLFPGRKDAAREPHRIAGKRKAVFVTTLLKKGFGRWVRRSFK